MRGWMLAALLTATAGCDTVTEILQDPPELPSGNLRVVDLVEAPTFDQLLGWSCFDYGGGDYCSLLGLEKPPKPQMQFSFDLVFDLLNPNSAFAIPLIEMLLGFVVYEDDNLGALCVSFCDPEDETCDPTALAEDACQAKPSDEVDDVDDLVPTVDDLIGIIGGIADGTIDDNLQWRTIPQSFEQMCHDPAEECAEQEVDGELQMCCGDVCEALPVGCEVGEGEDGDTCALCDGHVEAHIAFELDIDAMLGILEKLFTDAADAFLAGDAVQFVIPYTVDGTLFFDVPELGRKALGFGPFEDQWQVVE